MSLSHATQQNTDQFLPLRTRLAAQGLVPWRASRRRGALLPSLEISTGPLLPPTTVSATTAWSAFTVTCFTVICCCPLPRWRSSASESRASVRCLLSERQISGTHFE